MSKNATEIALIEDSPNSPKVEKKKRGRKPKAKIQTENNETKAKPKRGRKPKPKVKEVVQLPKSQSQSELFVQETTSCLNIYEQTFDEKRNEFDEISTLIQHNGEEIVELESKLSELNQKRKELIQNRNTKLNEIKELQKKSEEEIKQISASSNM